MTAAPLSLPPSIAIAWFKAPSIEFWSLPQCVQRLWEWLRQVKHRGETRFKVKDWELAEKLGIGRSCVQKALRWAEQLGLIKRYKVYGPRNHGRVIEIIINLAAPKPKQKATAKAKASRQASSQVPNVGEIQPATPEQQAAALAAITAAAPESEYVPTPEEEAATKSFWEGIKAKAAACKIPCGRNRPRISEEEMERRREASKAKWEGHTFIKDEPGSPASPSGP